MKCETLEQAALRYGPVNLVSRQWRHEARWMVICDVPPRIASVWKNVASGRGMLTHRIYCNRDMQSPLALALTNILDAGLEHELKTFDGCYEIRPCRGSISVLSAHAYGLAIDLNAHENLPGQEPRLSPALIQCWTSAGFDWGGNRPYKNGMHFSYAWEGNAPPLTSLLNTSLAPSHRV